jgi:hypothetical protein
MHVPRTTFVRDTIRALAFTRPNRAYVSDLLAIERLVTHGRTTWAGGMLAELLRTRHPREYDAISRELNPDGHDRARRERARRARAARDEERREAAAGRRQRERARKLWAALQ